MKPTTLVALLCVLASLALARASENTPITTGTLLEEMADLEKLARLPKPAFRTLQFSSYDRRSTKSEAPGWFSNADGFGGEPIPGFLRVLREPHGEQAGLYLLAEASGPGAIVRGWSAGMGGILRVYLDPDSSDTNLSTGTLIWEGSGYDFLARRSANYLKSINPEVEVGDAFCQQDADYLPIPFAHGLKVTWEGNLKELHFYHLQVRLYPEGTKVTSFDKQSSLAQAENQLREAIARLILSSSARQGESIEFQSVIEPGRNWTWSPGEKRPGAVRELKIRLQAEDLDTALRGCLLRIAFDGSQRSQVESPVGDFFGSGPGINPLSSVPFSVETNGILTCRFVMPYAQSVRLELVNYTPASVRLDGSITLSDWTWDNRSLYFRAKWRVDHDLLAGAGTIDLPYLITIGEGRFVGCAAMIMNPSGVPTAGGNWWGEGDEKFLVDGESIPSTFGTGSEDYFNYSWSRPDLFDHPYCGQPLDSGPDTAGYVSNHRFQIMDSISFDKCLGFFMELWSHNRTPGLSYARIAYHYTRPGAIDDHRGLMPSDLKIPLLPKRALQAAGAAAGAKFHWVDQLRPESSGGPVDVQPFPLATQLRLVQWQAGKGDRLKFHLPLETNGLTSIHLVAAHRPGGATVRVSIDGKPLPTTSGSEVIRLQAAFAPRLLNVHFKPLNLETGSHEMVLECIEAGEVGLDYLWIKNQR